jgi:hypothetical protein
MSWNSLMEDEALLQTATTLPNCAEKYAPDSMSDCRPMRLADGVERLCFGRGQGPQRCSLRAGFARREQQFHAVYRKGKYAESNALYEGAPFRVAHFSAPVIASSAPASRAVSS